MATFKRIEEIEAWVLARNICKEIYAFTKQNDFSKDFDLVKQIRRSSGSVMDNIAEGFGRGGNKEFINFLSIAVGSCCETKSQLFRSLDWKYISKDEFTINYNLAEEIVSKTGKLITYLNNSEYKGEKFKNRTSTNKQQTTNNKQQTN